MCDAKKIIDIQKNKKYLEKIRESLIRKNCDQNNEEIEFLLKRL
jgi:hypothetical protein